jgi:predicted HD phosphohydrolase
VSRQENNMSATPATRHDLIARVHAYQEACNRHDVAACLAMFAPGGQIHEPGRHHPGSDPLRDVHEYDRATNTQVAYSQYLVRDNSVSCRFLQATELDRLVGLDGLRRGAHFTFADGQIERIDLLPPSREEVQRHRVAKKEFVAWAKQHYPEDLEEARWLTGQGGTILNRLAHDWQESRDGAQETS